MEQFITAFATDDGKSFIDRHFGDADYYDLYTITPDEAIFLKRIINTTEEDHHVQGHGDAIKAHGIMGILEKESVSMVVSRVFGPNLKRIKNKFFCVLAENMDIAQSIRILQEKISLSKDEGQDHLKDVFKL
jgi:predicted Fe-Mo cluster-binding NifX family protein